MKFAVFGIVGLLGVAPLVTLAQGIAGTYIAPNESLTIERLGGVNQYRVLGVFKDGSWESIGHFDARCQCLKSVFRYMAPDRFKDAVGYHRFDFKEGGAKVVKAGGGWEGLSEFERIEYTKARQ